MHNTQKNYYIAETAFHHEGDINFLNNLVDELIKLDVQAIKFHLLFDLDDYIVHNHQAMDVLKKISIPQQYWNSVFEKVKSAGKQIIALTNDIVALQYINSIQNDFPFAAVELHASGLNDIFLLKESLRFNKTVMLGIGGSTFDEVQFAVDYLRKGNKEDILLMHGFQSYPTDYSNINFSRIPLIQSAFGLPVGYADHTAPEDKLNTLMSVLPVNIGVRVFEKHVTHVFGEKRIDAQAAISVDAMREVMELGNTLLKTVGDTPMQFSQPELNYGNTGPIKKALVARRDIEAGKEITLDDIAYKRTETSSALQQKDIFKLIGATANADIKKDEILMFDKINYQFKSANFSEFFLKK